ncbi:hypothetical protein [Streptomyces sp. NPDC059009]|uniref:hypothetical protein n=1 Tax=Streptomyces sp. NPDC059009 TaxID=3346694 RepID=UPI0036AA944F
MPLQRLPLLIALLVTLASAVALTCIRVDTTTQASVVPGSALGDGQARHLRLLVPTGLHPATGQHVDVGKPGHWRAAVLRVEEEAKVPEGFRLVEAVGVRPRDRVGEVRGSEPGTVSVRTGSRPVAAALADRILP